VAQESEEVVHAQAVGDSDISAGELYVVTAEFAVERALQVNKLIVCDLSALAERSERGRERGEAYVHFALGNPNRFRLMFGGQIEIGKHPELREAATRTYDGLVAAFRGQGDIANPEMAAAAAWALTHGLAHLLLDGHFRERAKAQDFVREVIGAVRFASAQRSA